MESAHADVSLQGRGLALMKDDELLTSGMMSVKIRTICGR